MLYVAIDQHAKQITVAIRNDQGEDVLKRQVSTRREKIEQFFNSVVAMDSEFMAILESCGFNDWLLEELRNRKCREIVLIHPEKPSITVFIAFCAVTREVIALEQCKISFIKPFMVTI